MSDRLPTSYVPRDVGELATFCERICNTGMIPPAYKGKPEEAFVAICWGKEVADLPPLTSLQYIAVINGRPGFYGDAVPGVAMMKGYITDIDEEWTGSPGEPDWTCHVTVRKGNGKDLTRSFSVADARRAGLWDKAGPWRQYPQRMLRWRATGYAVRDAAPHALFGYTVEELRDIDQPQPRVGPEHARDVTPADRERPAIEAKAEPPREKRKLIPLLSTDGEVLAEHPSVGAWLADFRERWEADRTQLTNGDNLDLLCRFIPKAGDDARAEMERLELDLAEDLAALDGDGGREAA